MTKARDLANASTALSAVSATELAFVDGVTSAIQTQMDTKLATATAATTYVANSLADAKGDIFVASADNTVTRLPVGNSGEQIVADSSTSTGLRYTAGNPIANPVINSAFQVWQRGTSFGAQGALGASAYTADRYQFYRGGGVTGATMSRQVTGDTTNLPNIQYCARLQRDSGNTSAATIYAFQTLESVNSIPFAGKTVTVSFYARAGANYSNVSSLMNFALISGTGTDGNVLAGFTGSSTVITTNVTLTTTWQRFTVSGTVPSNSAQLGFYPNFTPVGTAGAADYLDITGFQIDIGSVALPFRTNGATIQGELAACQRYYFRQGGLQTFQLFGSGYADQTTTAQIMMPLPVVMRVLPTSLDFSTLNLTSGGANFTVSSMTFNTNVSGNPLVALYPVTSGLTAQRPYFLTGNNSLSAYVGVSAEL